MDAAEATRDAHLVHEIPGFRGFLTPTAQKVYDHRTPGATTILVPERAPIGLGGLRIDSYRSTERHCRFLGHRVALGEHPEPQPEHVRHLAEAFNRGVAEGLLEHAVMCPALWIRLKGEKALLLIYSYSSLEPQDLHQRLGLSGETW